MKTSERIGLIVHVLNFVIFLYFSVTLIQADFLDAVGLLIAAVGLFGSLVVSIIGAVERLREG